MDFLMNVLGGTFSQITSLFANAGAASAMMIGEEDMPKSMKDKR